MSTPNDLYEEIKSEDTDAAEAFKAAMIDAMMGTESTFSTRATLGLRNVLDHWTSERAFAKKMASDPAFAAMAVGFVAKTYNVDIPVAATGVDAVLSTDDDTDGENEDA